MSRKACPKRHVCEECFKIYSSQGAISQHMKQKHNKSKTTKTNASNMEVSSSQHNLPTGTFDDVLIHSIVLY